MSLAEWGPWIGAIIGAGGLGTGVVALLKAKPEARKITADAAQVIQDASADWVLAVSEDLKELRRKVAVLEKERADRERYDVVQERRLRIHERWDIDMAEQIRRLGGTVTDPPPLYPDPAPA